jgi:hypothetical protein
MEQVVRQVHLILLFQLEEEVLELRLLVVLAEL